MSTSGLTEPLATRLSLEERQELEQRAEREDRSVAYLIRRYIREGLERDRQAEEA